MEQRIQKFIIGDEVYYSGFLDIYLISANKGNPNATETDILPVDWDYLITIKGGYGFIKVQENLIKKVK